MKNILHISYSRSGGAGRVAEQLCLAQSQINGYRSRFVYSSIGGIRANPFENIPLTIRAGLDNYLIKQQKWPTLFSTLRNVQSKKLDHSIINHEGINHLHWLGGAVKLEKILKYQKLGKKLIWTIHDMEPITGGCHYSINCENFKNSCKNCPAVHKLFVPMINKTKKSRNYIHSLLDKTIYVFPSKWLLEKFKLGVPGKLSSLEFVPNPIDSNFFIKKSQKQRKDYNKNFVIGFVCRDLNDPIKQFGLFLTSIQKLSQLNSTPIKIIAIGKKFERIPLGLNYIIEQPGIISDQNKLAQFYAEMNVLVSNSLSESFGLTIAEAAAAGVPSLVLEGSGSSELVLDKETGFLYKDQLQMIQVLASLIHQSSMSQRISENARIFAYKNWHIDSIVSKYDKIYENLN